MEHIYDILTNISGLVICGVILYYVYAFHKQDKELAKNEKN